ncbi:MAG: hypothetical protein OXQ29_09110 [Rhodospirillaceae bacterium]|nr:hypothetical protein [Rhodospirillaceae bacterium]
MRSSAAASQALSGDNKQQSQPPTLPKLIEGMTPGRHDQLWVANKGARQHHSAFIPKLRALNTR